MDVFIAYSRQDEARDALAMVSLDGALPLRSFIQLHAVDVNGLAVDEDSPRTAQMFGGIRTKLDPVTAARAVYRAGKPYDVRGRCGAQGPTGSPGADGRLELVQRAD